MNALIPLHPSPAGEARKARRQAKRETRRWRVDYDLLYDDMLSGVGFGRGKWAGHYRTQIGARVAAGLEVHFKSWGGSAVLVDTHRIVDTNHHSTGKR